MSAAVKIGVSADPPAIVVKYYSEEQNKMMHHLISLKRCNLDDSRAVMEYILKRHGEYFDSRDLVKQVLGKLNEKIKRKEEQRGDNTIQAWKKNKIEKKSNIDGGNAEKKPDALQRRETLKSKAPESPGKSSNQEKFGLKNYRQSETKLKDEEVSVEENDEEFIDDLDDAATFRSEDLGPPHNKLNQSKVANEGLPSLYKNQSLSKSKLSNNLVDSKKSLGKKLANDLKDSGPKSDREKIFEESGTKFPYKKEHLPGLNNSISDNFNDFDDFEADVPRKSIPHGVTTSGFSKQSRPKKDEFDDFDDFDDFQSVKKSNVNQAPAKKGSDDFEDIDDFDDIEDEVDDFKSEKSARKEGMSKTMPTHAYNDIKASELKIDYRTMDLNKLTDEEVAQVKKTMDLNFKQVKPGDEGFEYDKSVSFQQEESNEWDD